MSKFEEPLITLGVRRDEDHKQWEVYVQLDGETHYDSEEVAKKAMAEYLASMGPTIIEPARCIVIPRPQRHISSLLVQARPERLPQVEAELTRLAGVESHGSNGAGKLILTKEGR